MNVTNLERLDPEAGAISALAGRILAEVREAARAPDLTAVHQVIHDAGIRRARAALAESPDRLALAQAVYREAQAAESLAREAHASALLEAEYMVSGDVHTDGNKKYRWVACGEHDGGTPTPLCTECNGSGKVRLFMLADDVAKWKATESAKVPAVTLLAGELYRASENTAAARDAITVADKRMSACRADLEAACAELHALAIGLSSKENR